MQVKVTYVPWHGMVRWEAAQVLAKGTAASMVKARSQAARWADKFARKHGQKWKVSS